MLHYNLGQKVGDKLTKGAIQLLHSHSGREGEFLKMRTKANEGEGGFLPSRTFAKKFFFY